MSESSYPPPAFYFQVFFTGTINPSPGSFQEASGIQANLSSEEINEEEEEDNRFNYKIPATAKYENLGLKRGLMPNDSPIAKWCMETLAGGTNSIQPKDISVRLLDSEKNPLMGWDLKNAYPVSWNISNMGSMSGEIMIESLAFAYAYFTIEGK